MILHVCYITFECGREVSLHSAERQRDVKSDKECVWLDQMRRGVQGTPDPSREAGWLPRIPATQVRLPQVG